MNAHRFAAVLAGALVFSSSMLTEREARAKTHVGFDAEYASAIDEGSDQGGYGLGLRLGQELDLVILSLIPELGFDYHSFSELDTELYRGVVGGRLRFAKVLEPGVYTHLGVGRVDDDAVGAESWTGLTWDGGLLLDLTLIPVFEVGAHLGYGAQFGTETRDAFDWVDVGAHAQLVF